MHGGTSSSPITTNATRRLPRTRDTPSGKDARSASPSRQRWSARDTCLHGHRRSNRDTCRRFVTGCAMSAMTSPSLRPLSCGSPPHAPAVRRAAEQRVHGGHPRSIPRTCQRGSRPSGLWRTCYHGVPFSETRYRCGCREVTGILPEPFDTRASSVAHVEKPTVLTERVQNSVTMLTRHASRCFKRRRTTLRSAGRPRR